MNEDLTALLSKIQSLTLNDVRDRLRVALEEKNSLKSQILQIKLDELETRAKLVEAQAKLAGTYLEDCDGLWKFTRRMLPKKEAKQLELFDKIARTTLRECYEDIDTKFPNGLPSVAMSKSGSASFSIQDQVDIFNNVWSNERAHLIPDSPICAPKWGHSAEGALEPLLIEDAAKKNEARKLLVMGYAKSIKLRKKPQNFIKFAAHKEVFDVDPSVIIIPIMPLNEVLDWEDGTPYDALVIASEINKPGRTAPMLASQSYQEVLSQFNYNDASFCSPEELETATSLIRSFLLGHAGSLMAGIPTTIDPDKSTLEKRKVLDELENVKKDIDSHGVSLPSVHKKKTFRKVLKIRFSDPAPIPDPWLLAAKAVVNLSSTRGQKLLPAFKNGEEEEEEDFELLHELHKYEMRRRQADIPVDVNFCGFGQTPDTPPQTNRRRPIVVTPFQELDDDWETLGDLFR
jgi:hypothetical protein